MMNTRVEVSLERVSRITSALSASAAGPAVVNVPKIEFVLLPRDALSIL